MPSEYSYTAYGLKIASGLFCPELRLGHGAPDVVIRFGSIPDTLPEARGGGVCYQATAHQLLLTVPGVAKYLISGGREICVERAAQAEDDDVRLFLLGSALGALLHQCGRLVFNASAIETGGGAVAFLGHSGEGKSTWAALFHQRGSLAVADDLCVVSTAEYDELLLQPGFPQLNLWPDACQKLGLPLEKMRRVRPQLEKYALRLAANVSSRPLPLRRLYVLHLTNSPEAKFRELHGAEKLIVLVNHTYRAGYVKAMSRTAEHFCQCERVARQLPVIRVDLPRHQFPPEGLRARFEEDFQR